MKNENEFTEMLSLDAYNEHCIACANEAENEIKKGNYRFQIEEVFLDNCFIKKAIIEDMITAGVECGGYPKEVFDSNKFWVHVTKEIDNFQLVPFDRDYQTGTDGLRHTIRFALEYKGEDEYLLNILKINLEYFK